jgi:hypothetical protein
LSGVGPAAFPWRKRGVRLGIRRVKMTTTPIYHTVVIQPITWLLSRWMMKSVSVLKVEVACPLKCWYLPTKLHSITSPKIVILFPKRH